MFSQCCDGTCLIFACSGAADVGAIADRAARRLMTEGAGRMFCLAGVGGRIRGVMETTEAAARILAIDGCPLNCTKYCLEQAGFANVEHLQLADAGLEKGKSPVTDDAIAKVVARAKELLTRRCCS